MTIQTINRFVTRCALAGLVFLVASSKQTESSRPDDHAGNTSTQPAPATARTTNDPTWAVHGVPKELCFICDARLRDKDRLLREVGT